MSVRYLIMMTIIEESKVFLIVNKPSGMSVHNDQESVLSYFDKKGIPSTPVHRLDKGTSGLLLLAKNNEKVAFLQEALSKSDKFYLAICRGNFSGTSGRWEDPLSDKGEGYKNPRGMKGNQKACVTNWTKLFSNKYFSLMLFNIKTGRTHQIRRHCAIHKIEIIGDTRYGEPKYQKMISSKYNFKDMLLHSYKLNIEIENHSYQFVANYPSSFNELLGVEIEEFLQSIKT